jgi:hypothetical protein
MSTTPTKSTEPSPSGLQSDEAEDRTSAIGLARYAFDYLEAALVVDEQLGRGTEYSRIAPVPAYFLLSHSIELTLKAYLRHCGITMVELASRKYGHNLQVCYDQAIALGLKKLFVPFATDANVLSTLVHMNTDHQLRYIKTGSKTFTYWRPAESFAVRLHQAVAPQVGFPVLPGKYPEVETFDFPNDE